MPNKRISLSNNCETLSFVAPSIFDILNKSIVENSRLSLVDDFHVKSSITKSNSES